MLVVALLSAGLWFLVALTGATLPSRNTLLEPAGVVAVGCALYALMIAVRQWRASTWASRFAGTGTSSFRGIKGPVSQLLKIETSPYPAVHFENEEGVYRLSGVLLHSAGIDIDSLELVGRFEPNERTPRLESVRHHTFMLSRKPCVARSVLVFRSKKNLGIVSYISEEGGKLLDFWSIRESVQAALAEVSDVVA